MTSRTYFVGDLCNVTNEDEWHRICLHDDFYPATDPEDFDPEGFLDPEATYDTDKENPGRPFYILKTPYGDGHYRGSDGKNYPVDSGTIGCMAVDDIEEKEKLRQALEKGLGHLHEFEDFSLSSCGYEGENNEVLYFGELDIAA